MKKLLILLFCLSSIVSQAQQPFITTWDVTAGDLDITIPTNTDDYTYDYTIDFGDGTVLNNQTGDVTHTYASAGTYTVSISGLFPHYYTGSSGFTIEPNEKLKSIDQWGDNQWQSMKSAFANYVDMVINANDSPDLSQVSDMSITFFNCDALNQNINSWDVSNVTDMSRMFNRASSFNQNLNNWDTSNVIDMSWMFSRAYAFNQDIGNWDTSNVTDMSRMFQGADAFDNDIGNWDVSNVTDMNQMFHGANSFNQPLNNWNVSNVTNMEGVFLYASSFNQPLNSWNLSNVTDMIDMFGFANSFNQPLDNWDVSNVTDMSYMFFGTSNFNQPLNNWNVSNVTNMEGVFNGATSFNQPIDNWDVSNVTNMSYMFGGADSFNQNINNWDVSNVTDMSYMFVGTFNFNQPLNNWNVSNVTNMEGVFDGVTSFNQPIENWDVSNVTNMRFMFEEATPFNQPLNNWNVSNVTNMESVFNSATSFNQPLNNWDVSNVTNMRDMFRFATSFNQPLDDWDVSNVTNMFNMFSIANSFNQDLSSWNFTYGSLIGMLNYSGVSTENYDLLIKQLVNLNIINGFLGAEGIEYCDAFTRQQLINNSWNITDAGPADGCDLNYVSGQVSYDEMNNGCDAGDNGLSNYLINANNGSEDAGFAIDENGQYLIPLDSGNYTLSLLNLNANFTATPSTQSINFTGQSEIIEDTDFCVTADQIFDDLSVSILPLDDAIPGFETTYQLVINNDGTQTAPNVQTTFAYDDNFQTFVSASETPSANTTDLLTFDITDLQPFSQKIIELTLLNAVPPTLTGGEDLSFTAQVTPDVNDTNPDNNTAVYDQIVVNSFDPNDKLAVQGDEIVDEDTDRYLDYRIRFQNVGTANALNVKITDTIDDDLDWTTFQPISSSHNYRIEIIEGEQINYYFDNIDLPYEDLDEEGSNGYITYKIKPKSNVQIGDVIENTAYIYFDFNPPIVTNTVSTTVVDELSTEGFVKQESIRLFPNPADDQVELINNSDAEILQLKLYSINGKLIRSFNDRSILDVSRLSAGVYILQLETRYNKINKRLVKR